MGNALISPNPPLKPSHSTTFNNGSDSLHEMHPVCIDEVADDSDFGGKFEKCVKDNFVDNGQQMADWIKSAEEANKIILDECLPGFAGIINDLVELVFGSEMSAGFVCGVKQAVMNQGKSVPGRCCLNVPVSVF